MYGLRKVLKGFSPTPTQELLDLLRDRGGSAITRWLPPKFTEVCLTALDSSVVEAAKQAGLVRDIGGHVALTSMGQETRQAGRTHQRRLLERILS